MAQSNRSHRSGITPLQERFAQLVAAGKNHAEAYREASDRRDIGAEDAAKRGWNLASRLVVVERIEELRAQSQRKSILSLNDRLAILAHDAQMPGKSPGHINARSRAIEVYSKISGDSAPGPTQKIELSTAPGSALQVETRKLSVREKIAQLRIAREGGRGEPVAQPPPPAAPAAEDAPS